MKFAVALHYYWQVGIFCCLYRLTTTQKPGFGVFNSFWLTECVSYCLYLLIAVLFLGRKKFRVLYLQVTITWKNEMLSSSENGRRIGTYLLWCTSIGYFNLSDWHCGNPYYEMEPWGTFWPSKYRSLQMWCII